MPLFSSFSMPKNCLDQSRILLNDITGFLLFLSILVLSACGGGSPGEVSDSEEAPRTTEPETVSVEIPTVEVIVNPDVIPDPEPAPAPLSPAHPKLLSSAGKLILSWDAVDRATDYFVLRQASQDSDFVQVGEKIPPGRGEAIFSESLLSVIDVSYRVRACELDECVDSFVLPAAEIAADLVGSVKASNAGVSDYFGWSLALSGDGKLMAVGAPGENSKSLGLGGDQNDNTGGFKGAVYVFELNAGAWEQTEYIKSQKDTSGGFGRGITLSEDGNRMAIVRADVGPNPGIYVELHSRDDEGGWHYEDVIYSDHYNSPIWEFPSSLQRVPFAMSGDGNVIALQGSEPGSEYSSPSGLNLYSRENGEWKWNSFLGYELSGVDHLHSLTFGDTVALNHSGDTLVVGARWDRSTARGVDGDRLDNSGSAVGAVFVYVHRESNQWEETAYLKSDSIDNQGSGFGSLVDISGDGSTIVVTAPWDKTSALSDGLVYVFTNSSGAWLQQGPGLAARLSNSTDLDLSSNGEIFVVGAARTSGLEPSVLIGDFHGSGTNNYGASGRAQVYERNDDQWRLRATLSSTMISKDGRFGSSVGISSDGGQVVIGSPNEAGPSSDAGAVYTYW